MSSVMMDWMRSWEQVTLVAERFIDAGDQVVVIGDWRGRGRASGVVTNWRHGAVLTLRDGKAVSVVSYPDPADALQAVGRSE
jgi:ketosteroid isomerase-like protein